MKKRILLPITFLLFTIQFYSQNTNIKPMFEFFTKHSIGLESTSLNKNFILDNEASVYINSFGNTINCDSGTSVGGCILVNIISIFSAYEVSIGFDTFIGNSSPLVQPKIGVYLRPFYYGKIGVNFSTKNPMFSAGFTIPIKKFQLEFLYNNVYSYQTDPIRSSSRYQIGIMIPLN